MRSKIRILLLPLLISAIAIGTTIFVSRSSLSLKQEKRFHSEKEFKVLRQKMSKLKSEPFNPHSNPLAPGEYFLHSDNCKSCHGYDSAQYANVDASGMDVNLYDDWEASMMALSGKDPLWRAKVSHEILVNPSHSAALQDKCTSCHAPMGRYTNYFHGKGPYLIDSLLNDSLGLDGVSCTSCHTIGTAGAGFTLGNSFSGQIPYDTLKKIYGPYTNPILGPMQLYTGYTPTFAQHMSESRACSPCHTLIVETADLNGLSTGKNFVEQATYHEWLNSNFSSDNITCQNCHMPQITDSIRIANGYLNIPPRSPFNRHKFHGANSFMVNLMKNNKAKLNIKTPDKNFDSSIAIINRNIRYNTVELKVFQDSVTPDTAFYRVRLTNKAGHKFPSGYPSRRAVLQFVVLGPAGDTLFKSGIFDANGNIEGIGLSSYWAPHYQTIHSSNQTQIYEFIMGDVSGNRTTVLERADTLLKDNRLPPEGFSTSHNVYDTVKITADAMMDPDFNKFAPGVEGSGRDYVHFHIPVGNFPSPFSVYAKLYYQTLPPTWLQEMFSFSSAPIDTFKNMFGAANKAPLLVDSDSILNVITSKNSINSYTTDVKVLPNPTTDRNINLVFDKAVEISLVRITDVQGKLIKQFSPSVISNQFPVKLPEEKGIYIIDIYSDTFRVSKKVIFE
ncbi:MAG: T9SS type A sorting domain-containing protein [Bacteroidota bacterium]